MLRFIDLEGAYAAADEAVGGWLPGGGTPNPLSDTVRPVLDALPTAEIDPSLNNYYADKVEADQQRGERLATEGHEQMEAIGVPAWPYSPEVQAGIEESNANSREAALRGVVSNEEGRMLSTREEGQSDRQFYQQNLSNRESPDAEYIADDLRGQTLNRDWEEQQQQLADGTHPSQQREQSATEGVGWVETINNAEGMSTADGPDAGALGCVYGVNKVIKKAGLDVPWKDPETGEESVYIPFVTNWITSNGGEQVSHDQAKPGDIIVVAGEHMGILTNKVDGNGYPIVLSNSSSRSSMSWEFALEGNMAAYRVPQLQR